ncbi:response regulator [[Limnothrix rosea] IAM M-220]|uniref:response regulator n=1 Tax=[Limnothrix rosea] IAM M-220 TaxID=454133 RepID=UPI00096139A9|nr:adenylate/guanylate cyclase domain-containing protein [[Limnothrix rosea] IAM M-220]OKH16857.1 adenylate/guanylate cyclase domain-containing response regulator [[Limnothrix rosea] IAM M-220]
MPTNPPRPYILLVDDEPNNLFLLEELLAGEGYRTYAAKSGIEALAAVECELPDIILLDVMMPGMNGFEVCRHLRENDEYNAIPVIFLTALDDEESRLTGIEMMSDDYLTKPIRSELLLLKVRNILKLQKMRQQSFQKKLQKQIDTAWNVSESLTEKFRLFVPDQFLQRIAPDGLDSIQVGNAREEELTILFCDIREFTTIAENQDPKQTFAWLNGFFEHMNEAIDRHHGFIDKFLGDAIMAVFDRTDHHGEDAIFAALMMEENLQLLNDTYQDALITKPIRMGVGIHTGLAVIGTVGASSRMDSTVIGDVVNTASRLEELTKTYGCNIIVSGQTRAHLTSELPVQWHLLDQLKPRGKQQIIDLYEVTATAKKSLSHNWQAVETLSVL